MSDDESDENELIVAILASLEELLGDVKELKEGQEHVKAALATLSIEIDALRTRRDDPA